MVYSSGKYLSGPKYNRRTCLTSFFLWMTFHPWSKHLSFHAPACSSCISSMLSSGGNSHFSALHASVSICQHDACGSGPGQIVPNGYPQNNRRIDWHAAQKSKDRHMVHPTCPGRLSQDVMRCLHLAHAAISGISMSMNRGLLFYDHVRSLRHKIYIDCNVHSCICPAAQRQRCQVKRWAFTALFPQPP